LQYLFYQQNRQTISIVRSWAEIINYTATLINKTHTITLLQSALFYFFVPVKTGQPVNLDLPCGFHLFPLPCPLSGKIIFIRFGAEGTINNKTIIKKITKY
jgi:hypothetical protein